MKLKGNIKLEREVLMDQIITILYDKPTNELYRINAMLQNLYERMDDENEK